MHGLELEKMHQALELSLAKLDCAALAAIASSSTALRAAVSKMVTNKSTASYLLCTTVRDAAVHEAGASRQQHIEAIRWLLAPQHCRSTDILQGSTAAALLSTPLVPEEAAAALAAAGLRFSWQQVVEACARPVAGAWVWVKAGAVTDAPELAEMLVFEPKRVSACPADQLWAVCQQLCYDRVGVYQQQIMPRYLSWNA
jgi:hypothetical protein